MEVNRNIGLGSICSVCKSPGWKAKFMGGSNLSTVRKKVYQTRLYAALTQRTSRRNQLGSWVLSTSPLSAPVSTASCTAALLPAVGAERSGSPPCDVGDSTRMAPRGRKATRMPLLGTLHVTLGSECSGVWSVSREL